MVRRRINRGASDGLFSLLVLSVCFAVGTLSGFLFALLGGDHAGLTDYLLGYFRLAGHAEGLSVSLWAVFWDLVRWPLFALLLGFTALGVAGVPILLLVRGFLLSYAASVMVRIFGTGGMLAALSAFGVTAVFSIPVLMAVCCNSFYSAVRRLPGSPEQSPRLRSKLPMLAPCTGVTMLAAALQWAVMPALLAAVCAKFFSL